MVDESEHLFGESALLSDRNYITPERRKRIISLFTCLWLTAALLIVPSSAGGNSRNQIVTRAKRPNILIAMSDDQSYPSASAYGDRAINTPAFDRVAREGLLFTNAFVASPGCSPSRAAFLTGRNAWQLEQAGTHASSFPQKYVTFPDLLERAGYLVGYTGKGWGPGNWKVSGRSRNPAGTEYNRATLKLPRAEISKIDYVSNFKEFLAQRGEGQPFYFWYGANEPHRAFEKGGGLKRGKKLADARVPTFLPDTPEVRSDILDYAVEIEDFDQNLGRMLQMLEEAGELDQTIVIVTSDNGMAFPRAKANCYEYGIHVPLAVRWADRAAGGRVVNDVISLLDLTPTILEAARVKRSKIPVMSGHSIMNILRSGKQKKGELPRNAVFAARERHSSSRYDNLSYPQRAVRTKDFLFIRNYAPERWPAGDPQEYNDHGELEPMHEAYRDIDPSPTLEILIAHRTAPGLGKYFHLAVDKRPSEELYDISKDPGCLHNLANDAAYAGVKKRLRSQLNRYLIETKDPRAMGHGEVFETYERYSPIRKFPVPGS